MSNNPLTLFYFRFGKRLFDIVFASVLLVGLAPLLVILWLAVRIRLGSPAIFRQQRAGKNGEVFTIYKFRSMSNQRDANGEFLSDELRITRFGSFLRSSSLDELPELWNIVLGKMSFVGPRPLKTTYLPLYNARQSRRHEVLPGISGWAQVNGRNSLDWDERFELDAWYVDNRSFWLDLKILWMTVGTVFGRHGVSAEGHTTMPDFQGSSASVLPRVNQDSMNQNGTRHLSPRPWSTEDAMATRKRIVVIGGGGHAKVVVSTLRSLGATIDAIYDDDDRTWGKSLLGVPVRGPISELNSMKGVCGVIAIGRNDIREHLDSVLQIEWLTIIHPRAWVDSSAEIGAGTVIFAGAVVQAEAVIGRHSIVNTSASVDHDCVLGNFTSIGPGTHLSGAVSIGDRCMLGTGCAVLPKIKINDDVVIGAGTVVIRDLPAGCTLVGAAPRIIKPVMNAKDIKEAA